MTRPLSTTEIILIIIIIIIIYTFVDNNSPNTTKFIYIKLTFQPQLEAFIRISWYSVFQFLTRWEDAVSYLYTAMGCNFRGGGRTGHGHYILLFNKN